MSSISNKRVLVVDSKLAEQRFTSELLTKYGYVVGTAVDSVTTMQFLESNSNSLPDVILMEVILPGMNGFQLTQAITHDERYSHIPIIMVTSKNQETDRLWGMRQGAQDYLVKPFRAEVLIAKLKALF